MWDKVVNIRYNEDGTLKKPPLGIMPERFWKEIRLQELNGAIARYIDADSEIPIEWIEERNRLIKEIMGGKA